MEIDKELYEKLEYLGLIDSTGIRSANNGNSNYHTKTIQPWTIWLDYPELTSWDNDIIKRVLRQKPEPNMTELESRELDYRKIIHNCQERLRQIEIQKNKNNNV